LNGVTSRARCSTVVEVQNQGLEAVMEHLVGRQSQPRGAQVHAMLLSDQQGCSQHPPLFQPSFKGWQWR